MIEQRKQTKQPTKLWKINLINIPRGENWQNYLFGGKKEVYTQIAILLLLLTMLRDMYIYRILFASVLFASLLIRFFCCCPFVRSFVHYFFFDFCFPNVSHCWGFYFHCHRISMYSYLDVCLFFISIICNCFFVQWN